MGYGEFIKNTRKNMGYTVHSLAKKVGVSPVAISNWENEKYPPTNANNISALELKPGELYRMLYGNPTQPLPQTAETGQGKRKAV